MGFRNGALQIGALAALAMLFGCGPAASAEKAAFDPNALCPGCSIVLVAVDPMRADALPCYGYDRKTAPNICRYARKGLLFERAYSQTSYTLDSSTSVFTSQFPSSHGVLVPLRDNLPAEIVTLPERLSGAGYETLYFGSKEMHIGTKDGLPRGFADGVRDGSVKNWLEGISRLERGMADGRPVFLYLQSFALHSPYLRPPGVDPVFAKRRYVHVPATEQEFKRFTPVILSMALRHLRDEIGHVEDPEEQKRLIGRYEALRDAASLEDAEGLLADPFWDDERWTYFHRSFEWLLFLHREDPGLRQEMRARYDDRLLLQDRDMGPVLDRLNKPKIRDKTIVVLLSHHGEEFGEHGDFIHSRSLYNNSTWVPLIMVIPGVEPRRIDALVQGIDLFPTLLSLVGVPAPAGLEGIDLTGVIRQEPDAVQNEYLISERLGGHLRSIQDGRWKLYTRLEAPEALELYDLKADPAERVNVAASHPEQIERLAAALKERMKRAPRLPDIEREFPGWLNPRKRERLIENGYF